MRTLFFTVLFFLTTIFSYSQNSQTFSGNYRSIMGVMNSLSCYCDNGGYLTYDKDQVVSISFDKMKIAKVKSGEITVFGHFEDITHESQDMDACPSGTRSVFIVDSFYTAGHKDVVFFEKEWNGKWITTYGVLEITVDNNNLTGIYSQGTISGNLVKTNTGSEIQGKWIKAGKNAWFSFYKNANEGKFSGEWGYENEEGTVEGKWYGKR